MDHSDKPQRSEGNQSVRYDRAATLLNVFADYVTKGETDKTDRVYPFVDPENTYHPVSMEKYISVDKGIDEQKNTEKKEEIRMTHDYFL